MERSRIPKIIYVGERERERERETRLPVYFANTCTYYVNDGISPFAVLYFWCAFVNQPVMLLQS